MVTGVIALVRQANPNLTWRDVKLILAESANKTPTSGQVYKVTGKMYSDPAKDQMYENNFWFWYCGCWGSRRFSQKDGPYFPP